MYSLIEPVGKLYQSDIKDLYLEKNSLKLIYATLRSLSDSQFAKQHEGWLNLSTSDIAKYGSNIFSARSVRRHLNSLLENKPDLYSESYAGSKQRLNIQLPKPKGKGFVFVVAPIIPELLQASTILFLSLVLDRAAFNYREYGNFTVSPKQLSDIQNELGLTKVTVVNHLRNLYKYGFLNPLGGYQDSLGIFEKGKDTTTGHSLYKFGIILTQTVFDDYAQLVELKSKTQKEFSRSNLSKTAKKPKSNIFKHLIYNTFNTKSSRKIRKPRSLSINKISQSGSISFTLSTDQLGNNSYIQLNKNDITKELHNKDLKLHLKAHGSLHSVGFNDHTVNSYSHYSNNYGSDLMGQGSFNYESFKLLEKAQLGNKQHSLYSKLSVPHLHDDDHVANAQSQNSNIKVKDD